MRVAGRRGAVGLGGVASIRLVLVLVLVREMVWEIMRNMYTASTSYTCCMLSKPWNVGLVIVKVVDWAAECH